MKTAVIKEKMEKEASNKRVFISALLVLCVCVVLVAGATYALFTAEASFSTHLEAGKLEIGLERVRFELMKHLGEDGYIVDTNGTTDKDTTVINLVENNDPVFSVSDVVPGCVYEADIKVQNLGKVAFTYGIKMVIENSAIVNETLSDEDLAKLGKQIKITFLRENAEIISFTLDEANNSFNKIDMGSLTANSKGKDTDIITIRAELLDDVNNNMVQSKTFEFDIVVYATQQINEAA